MALNSIYGRTTNSLMSGQLLRATSSTIENMFTTQQQIATGRSILTTSMDPLGAAEFLRYSNRSATNDIYRDTVSDLSSSYNFIDAQVGEAVDVTNQLRQIALRESNDGAADEDTRSLSVTEVNNLQSSLLALANAELNGKSLFAGSNTSEDAFTAFGDALVFNGDFEVNQRYIEDNMSFDTSLTADQVFGDILTTSAARNDLNVALNFATVSPSGSAQVSTSLDSLNGGRGVDLDTLSIVILPDGGSNPSSGVTYTADLRGAKTIADVGEILNNVRGRDGNPVFDVDVYEGFGTNFPQAGMSATSGLRITAVGEAAQAVQGRPATILFQNDLGRTTARDLGLITGQISYQTTSRELPAGPYTGPLTFDMKVNGQNLPITVNPAAPMGADELAAALNTEANIALRTQGMFDFTVAVNGVDSDGDTLSDSLSIDISDASGTASFELVGTNPASLPLADAMQNGTLTGPPSFTQNPGSFTNGVFAGRDLNPALSLATGISALNGGEGFQLEVDSTGNPITPQGLRIENGSLSADINLADILANPNANIGDLINRINGSGVQVEARIAESGDRLEIVSRLVGVPVTIENANGSIATQLGIDSRFSEMRTIDLNDGRGIGVTEGADFKAIATDGTEVSFDLGAAKTVSGVIAAINDNAANVRADGTRLFDAKAITERSFDTTSLTTQIAGPGVSPVFQVSFNGSEVRTIDLGGPHTSLDTMAAAMESELNRVANQLGMDGFSAEVHADNGAGRLGFQLQDANGPAEIDFSGGFTAAFGLDGSVNGAGTTMLQNEASQNRIVFQDTSFDPSTYVQGDPQPVIQNLGVSSVLEDLGIIQSDASRLQTIGAPTVPADSAAARTFTIDMNRGPQLTVNVAAQLGRTTDQFAVDFDAALRTAINAAGIEGYSTSVRVDSTSGGVMVEVTDGLDDAAITLSGADAVAFGLDAATAVTTSPSGVVFNVVNGSYEGKDHALNGLASANIFTTINDLKNALSRNASVGIASTLGNLESSIDLMLEARGESGSRVRRLTLADTRLGLENDHLDELATGVMGLDLAEAATRLAQQENLFQAGIQASAKISRISLLDYI